jgi:hypothetical protein
MPAQIVKFLCLNGGIMSMDKKILMIGILLLFCSSVFALNTNTIKSFSLSWNPNTNQLGINAECKGEALAVLVLSTGAEKTIICSTMNVGATWLIGEQPNDLLTGTLTISSPCDVCQKTATISLSNPDNQNDLFFSIAGFGLLLIIIIAVVGWGVSFLQR